MEDVKLSTEDVNTLRWTSQYLRQNGFRSIPGELEVVANRIEQTLHQMQRPEGSHNGS